MVSDRSRLRGSIVEQQSSGRVFDGELGTAWWHRWRGFAGQEVHGQAGPAAPRVK